jgi:hypothetical protein
MGWKLGYITSLDGTRVKLEDTGLLGADGTTMTVVEEVGTNCEKLAEVEKLSEYDGGWELSTGVGKDGDSGWYSKMASGGWDAFSEGAGNSRLAPSVVPRRPLVFSAGKIMSELGVEKL